MDSLGNGRLNAKSLRTALVVAHPGHELLVHGWLEAARPLVFVLTDGSGRLNQSRLTSTTKVLNQTGARSGAIYGRLTDTEAYATILNHQYDLFIGLARELCEALVAERIDYLAGDALEGYNPMHDVCRLVIDAAVTAARRARGHTVANFAFSLIDQQSTRQTASHVDGICRLLDDSALARKMSAAKEYAELAGEIQPRLQHTSTEALRTECLHPVNLNPSAHFSDPIPFYEQYGEQQVAAGYYRQVIRFNEHLAPLAEALARS
ncbi:MAG: hypothetical protein ABI698_04725 [bacterium]